MSKILLKITGILEILLAIALLVMSLYTLGSSDNIALLIAPHDKVAKTISICIIAFPVLRLLFGILGVAGKAPSLLTLGGFLMIFTSVPLLGTEKPLVHLYISAALVSLIFLLASLFYKPEKIIENKH